MSRDQRCGRRARLRRALERFLTGRDRRDLFVEAYRLTRDEGEAWELVTEACYRALKSWRRYDAGKRFFSFLRVILRNAFLDSRKSAPHRWGVSLYSQVDGQEYLVETLADSEASAAELLEREERERSVAGAIARLPTAYGRVVTLCTLGGLSYKETARHLKIPMGTVRSRLFNARRMLRRDGGLDRFAADYGVKLQGSGR